MYIIHCQIYPILPFNDSKISLPCLITTRFISFFRRILMDVSRPRLVICGERMRTRTIVVQLAQAEVLTWTATFLTSGVRVCNLLGFHHSLSTWQLFLFTQLILFLHTWIHQKMETLNLRWGWRFFERMFRYLPWWKCCIRAWNSSSIRLPDCNLPTKSAWC